jgi:plastocyanin
MRPTFFLGSVATLVALAVAGCGGGGYDSPAAPTPPSGQPSPSPTPPASTGTTISIVGDRGALSFAPNPVSVDGTRMVSWRNNDSVVHRIVLNDGSMDTGNIAPGAASPAAPLPGDGANYHCALHPGMIGAINASGGAPPPCTGIYC